MCITIVKCVVPNADDVRLKYPVVVTVGNPAVVHDVVSDHAVFVTGFVPDFAQREQHRDWYCL